MVTDNLDVAVAHDQMWVLGGAERVALHIGKALDAPVITTFAGEDAREAAGEMNVTLETFSQGKYSGLGRWRQREGFKSLSLMLDWQTAPLEDYEIIVSCHMFTRHYRTLDDQYLLNYCHSPPRWLNDLQSHRLSGLPKVARPVAKAYMTAMDVLDSRSATRVDSFIANSEVIEDRIQRYYRRNASVIYPPIDTENIRPAESNGDYYLMVGRVVESKRPWTVLEAFEDVEHGLKIAGGADNEPLLGTNTLEQMRVEAGRNVDVLGYVSDGRKEELLRNAKAVIYIPVREDFGMVPIEALAAGTPVIAANEGFPAIVIEDEETGVIVEPSTEGVQAGVERIESMTFDPDTLAAVAENYSTVRFENRIREAVTEFESDPDKYRCEDELLLE
jgi:glycosyltransferase involved in cell wall biosynthesis